MKTGSVVYLFFLPVRNFYDLFNCKFNDVIFQSIQDVWNVYALILILIQEYTNKKHYNNACW